MKQSVLRRVLSVLLCVSLLLGVSVVRPQKAEAFAISASVVASVILIMTACGVSFWASTQGDAESYISQKLGEYLDQLNPSPSSILDWLGIQNLVDLFTVVNGGIVRFEPNVANPILDFVRWFNQEEGVVSGGSAVGELGGLGDYSFEDEGVRGTVAVSYADDNVIIFTLTDVCSTSAYYAGRPRGIVFDAVSTGTVTATLTALTSSYDRNFYVGMSSGLYNKTVTDISARVGSSASATVSGTENHLCLGFYLVDRPWSGTVSLRIAGDAGDIITPATTSVTPSEVVSVPDDPADDESFDVSPSVSLPADSSVDDTAALIFDRVVSQGGLTSDSSIYSPPLVDLSGIESRLDAIEAALIALDTAVDSVDGDTSDIQGSIATLLSRASSIQNSIATLDNNLDNVDDNVNDVALAVSGISGKIDNLESDVAGLVGSLGSISQGNSDIQDSIAGLNSAMSALSADMELVKDALAGLTANDSLVDDVADIKTNTSGLSGFLSSIQYYIERVLDILSDFFTGFFDNLASAFIDLINSLKAMLLDLFIPDEAFVDAYVADLQFKMDNHFSILSYPFSLLGRFIGESALQAEGDGILSWPDIYEPFSHTLIIRAGSYCIYDAIDDHNFYRIYNVYRIVLQGYITFDFISYLYFWFCDVFKMRELDFPNPLEVEE